MKVLGIDSSSLVASVAVVTDDVLTAEFTVNHKKTHSQTLLPMLDQMMALLGMDLGEIDVIAVAAGPGSFTGLRIGAATAKGLGLALGKPLAEIPTLEALACNLWGVPGLVCPIMDARRNQVYAGVYRVSGGEERARLPEIVAGQCAVDILELINRLNRLEEPVTFLGDGVPVYEEQILAHMAVPFSFAPAQNSRQRASSAAVLGAAYARLGRTVTAAEFKVDYLRKSQAEREREERMAAGQKENGL